MRYTKWNIQAGSITLYPSGVFKIIGIAITALSAAFAIYFLVMLGPGGKDPCFIIPFFALLFLPGLFLFLGGFTRIVFDDNERSMKRYLFGFLKNKTVAYDDIAAIESYGSNTGMNYRIFLKENRHGKGIAISSGYTSAQHTAAMVFRRELIPLLEQRVKAGSLQQEPVTGTTRNYITDFSYYKEQGNVYTLKTSHLPSLIIGLALFAWGIYALTLGSGNHYKKASDAFFATYFPLIIGFAFLVSCFTKTMLDKAGRKIILSYAGGLYKKEYFFSDFVRYLIVRKTTNMIYSGTDVRMELQPAGKTKTTVVTMRSFGKTRKIERFIEETNAIMDKV